MLVGNNSILIRLVHDAMIRLHRLSTLVQLSQLARPGVPRTI